MAEKSIERRLCLRFKLPGATVSIKKIGLFGGRKKVIEDFCPVLDMSRGGIRFLTQKLLPFRSRVEVQLCAPGESVPLRLIGRVIWASFNPGKSYKFQAGIKFNPYGQEKNHNDPSVLTKIMSLEEKFPEPGDSAGTECPD